MNDETPNATETRSKDVALTAAVVGFAAILFGFFLFADYVSSDSGVSGTVILILVAGGFTVALIGLVMWCRQSTKMHRRTMSRILLALGTLTFCLALLGHVLETFVAIAIPTLLLGIVVRLVPARKTNG